MYCGVRRFRNFIDVTVFNKIPVISSGLDLLKHIIVLAFDLLNWLNDSLNQDISNLKYLQYFECYFLLVKSTLIKSCIFFNRGWDSLSCSFWHAGLENILNCISDIRHVFWLFHSLSVLWSGRLSLFRFFCFWVPGIVWLVLVLSFSGCLAGGGLIFCQVLVMDILVLTLACTAVLFSCLQLGAAACIRKMLLLNDAVVHRLHLVCHFKLLWSWISVWTPVCVGFHWCFSAWARGGF